MLTEAQLLIKLSERCAEYGGQAAFARKHGFTHPFISMVLNGKTGMTERLANALGYVQRAAYLPMRGEGA